MKRLVVLLSLGFLAACGDRPGSKSTVTAYGPDGTTVIKFEPCPRIGRSYDYPTCGKKLRTEVNASLCAQGGGSHAWFYQIGSSSPIPEHALCR